MAITVWADGLNRILMPDGTYLQWTSGGNGTSWCQFGPILIFSGTISVNGNTLVNFPLTFPNACACVVVHEANAGGWAGSSVGVFATYARSTSSCYIRVGIKSNGGIFTCPGTGQTANWVAIGY